MIMIDMKDKLVNLGEIQNRHLIGPIMVGTWDIIENTIVGRVFDPVYREACDQITGTRAILWT